jgi:hypothetical protein
MSDYLIRLLQRLLDQSIVAAKFLFSIYLLSLVDYLIDAAIWYMIL